MSRQRRLLLLAITATLTVVLLELGLRLVYQLVPGEAASSETRYKAFPYYRQQPWGKAYWEHFFRHTQVDYAPYIVWRRPQITGDFINTDPRGIRHPLPPRALAGPDDVFVLGGSTVWGVGARDTHTIPALLEEALRAGGMPVETFNLGESGFVARQELVYLTLLLKQGHRPGHVVFYDGANEAFAAWQSGQPGVHQNLNLMKDQLHAQPLEQTVMGLRRLVYATALHRTYRRTRQLLKGPGGAHGNDPKALQTLAAEVAAEYQRSADYLYGLAQSFGFQLHLFWQPVAFTQEKLLEAESHCGDPQLGNRALETLCVALDRHWQEQPESGVINLSGALAERTQPVFFDWCHITEQGNALVARAMAAHMLSGGAD